MAASKMSPKPSFIKKHFIFCLTGLVFILLIGVGIFQTFKPLPAGISFKGPVRPVHFIKFYRDLTWAGPDGNRQTDHKIFDAVFDIIHHARKTILVDMFLFNNFSGASTEIHRPVSHELVDALVKQKQKHPDMYIGVITDPINIVYGGLTNPLFEHLQNNGIAVTFTRLDAMRDSNPLYSAFWRVFIRPFGNGKGDLLPNPFGRGRVSLRSYLKMLNFKANHRKIIIADHEGDYVAMVSSANPHDASSFHDNCAVMFTGPAVSDLFDAEKAVLNFSGGMQPPQIDPPEITEKVKPRIQVITESRIKQTVLSTLNQTTRGDRIFLVMFYLSDRDIISALKAAFHRGVPVQVLLDPNKDAFGYKKNGIPNRQTAAELIQAKIPVKWIQTHGEQSHTKMLLVDNADGSSTLIAGSANYTRRNLDDYNLEADVAVYGPGSEDFFIDARSYCGQLWNNPGSKQFSTAYGRYAEPSWLKHVLYRWMEATGMCTF